MPSIEDIAKLNEKAEQTVEAATKMGRMTGLIREQAVEEAIQAREKKVLRNLENLQSQGKLEVPIASPSPLAKWSAKIGEFFMPSAIKKRELEMGSDYETYIRRYAIMFTALALAKEKGDTLEINFTDRHKISNTHKGQELCLEYLENYIKEKDKFSVLSEVAVPPSASNSTHFRDIVTVREVNHSLGA